MTEKLSFSSENEAPKSRGRLSQILAATGALVIGATNVAEAQDNLTQARQTVVEELESTVGPLEPLAKGSLTYYGPNKENPEKYVLVTDEERPLLLSHFMNVLYLFVDDDENPDLYSRKDEIKALFEPYTKQYLSNGMKAIVIDFSSSEAQRAIKNFLSGTSQADVGQSIDKLDEAKARDAEVRVSSAEEQKPKRIPQNFRQKLLWDTGFENPTWNFGETVAYASTYPEDDAYNQLAFDILKKYIMQPLNETLIERKMGSRGMRLLRNRLEEVAIKTGPEKGYIGLAVVMTKQLDEYLKEVVADNFDDSKNPFSYFKDRLIDENEQLAEDLEDSVDAMDQTLQETEKATNAQQLKNEHKIAQMNLPAAMKQVGVKVITVNDSLVLNFPFTIQETGKALNLPHGSATARELTLKSGNKGFECKITFPGGEIGHYIFDLTDEKLYVFLKGKHVKTWGIDKN